MQKGGYMNDFKKVFAKKGYELFEPESIEHAIIDAIENKELRYLYGIPIVLENSEINFKLLIDLAKNHSVLDMLYIILNISSRIIKDKSKVSQIKKMLSGKKIKKRLNDVEFQSAYAQYRAVNAVGGFSSNLHYHLSMLFAPRQIEILNKIKKGGRLNKTESEYYSRTIKKKLIAIKELSSFSAEFIK